MGQRVVYYAIMTFSPLTSRTIPTAGKYSSRGGADIVRLNEHHWASTGGGEERMIDPDENVSCNYLILTNGELVGQVPEEYRAFTSGSPAADNPAITVEIQNSSRHVANGNNLDPDSWPVSDAAFATLCALLADLYTRYGWADLGPSRLRGHLEFASTACPGGYLWARRELARNTAAELLNGNPTTPTEEDEDMSRPICIAKTTKGQDVEVTIFNFDTGEEHVFGSSRNAEGVSYNNNVALTYGCAPLVPVSYVSVSHYDKIKSENAATRRRLAELAK